MRRAADKSSLNARSLNAKSERSFYVALALGVSGVLLMCAENARLRDLSGEADGVCEMLKLLTAVLTGWTLVFDGLFFWRRYELFKATNVLLANDTFASSGLLLQAVLEGAALAVFAPPFLLGEVDIEYFDPLRLSWRRALVSTDELVTIAMACLRLPILLLRMMRYASGIESEMCRGDRPCLSPQTGAGDSHAWAGAFLPVRLADASRKRLVGRLASARAHPPGGRLPASAGAVSVRTPALAAHHTSQAMPISTTSARAAAAHSRRACC